MQVTKNTVVTLSYQLTDRQGEVIDAPGSMLTYLHGGYDEIFPLVEQALDAKDVGDECFVQLEPEEAFGDYDEQLLRIEPRELFPSNVEVGMQFEGTVEGGDEGDTILFTVTDVADDKVVVDGNHPLAGMALDFRCKVVEVRGATDEEIEHGHSHGHGDEHDGHGH